MLSSNASDRPVTTETITPEQARLYLQFTVPKRGLNSANIERFSKDMVKQVWDRNGETVKFCPAEAVVEGVKVHKLGDGLHRMNACIKAGVPFTTLVVWNVPEEEILSVDTGKSRTGGDALTMRGHKYGNVMTGAIRWIHSINPRGGSLRRSTLTNAQIIKWTDAHPEIEDNAKLFYNVKPAPPALVIGLHWLFSRIDLDEATRFAVDLRDGANLPEGDPVLTMRNRLIENQLNRNKERLDREDKASLLIRTWNARRRGEVDRQIKRPRAGGALPAIVGWSSHMSKGAFIEEEDLDD
jgi:hypothetical protein